MMIELTRRGFAPVAAVLSFIADNGATQESIWLACRRLYIPTEFSEAGDHTSLVMAFVTLT